MNLGIHDVVSDLRNRRHRLLIPDLQHTRPQP